MPSNPVIQLSVRQLVEFLLRTGSIDSRFTGFDRANEGARIHRKLQKAAGEGYAAEVFLSASREIEGISFAIEGRADGIFTDESGVTVIDEIKTTAIPTDEIREDMNPCHWSYLRPAERTGPAGRPADLLPDRHRRDHPLPPFVFLRRTGRLPAGSSAPVCPMGQAPARLGRRPPRQPFGAEISISGISSGSAGTGRGNLPCLCGGKI